MKVAIPMFGERVSPRFDCAQAFLVVTVEDGKLSKRQEVTAAGWAPHERINGLVELAVDTVICGGIDCWSAESLRTAGVTIYGWVTGKVEDALTSLVQGNLDSEAMVESGGRCEVRPFSDCAIDRDQEPPAQQGARHARGRGRGHGGGCGGHGRQGPRNGR